jgi:hypothetical protein
MMSDTGPIMVAAVVALLWYMRPGSRLNRWATTPMLELLIPIVIVGLRHRCGPDDFQGSKEDR